MGRSNRLKLADVRDTFHLVRKVCELGDDSQAWRSHLLTRLAAIIGASTGVAYVMPMALDPRNIRLTALVQHNFGGQFEAYLRRADLTPDPKTPAIMESLHRGFTRTRQTLCDDQAWYGSAYFNEVMLQMRLDHEIVSIAALPHLSRISGMGFERDLGDAPFGERERSLLALFHRELALLWRTPALAPGDPRAALPVQLRRVLDHVAAGMSERQTALRMSLSQHTVHSYLKVLHRRFDATSRAELIDRSRPCRPALRPRLEDFSS